MTRERFLDLAARVRTQDDWDELADLLPEGCDMPPRPGHSHPPGPLAANVAPRANP